MFDIEKLAERLAAAAAELPADDDPTEHLETVEHPEVQKEPTPRPALGTVTVLNFFRHPQAHPLVLDLCLLKKYGPDFLTWEPETLEIRVPQDFRTTEVSDLNMAKIQACRTIHLVDTFWDRWEVFCWVTAALNGHFPDFDALQVPTVSQAAIAVNTAQQMRDDVPWSSEVKTFLAQVFRFEGIFFPIPPLDFVPVETDGFVVDPKELGFAWLGRKKPTDEETVLNEQLRRLYAVQAHLDDNRALLRAQLPLVQHV